MIDIQADIPLGEAIRPAALAQEHVYRPNARAIFIPALALAGSIILATIFGMLLPLLSFSLQPIASLLWIAGAFLGLIAALKIFSREHMRGFLAGLKGLGSPAVFHTRFQFDEEGIAISSQRSSWRCPWTSVLFVIPAPEHWLIQVDVTTLALPRRIFAERGQEQAFLDLAGRGLTLEAKGRSKLVR
jgi:hypothetical protein